MARPLPGCDRSAAPFLGLDVTHRLAQFPAMTAQVLDKARTLAVFPRSWFLEDAGAEIAGLSESFVDVRHAHLDDVRDEARTRRHVIAMDVGDDDGAVRSNTQLSAVRISDPHSLRKSEGGFQPCHRGSHVGVDQHRRHCGGGCRAIRQHR